MKLGIRTKLFLISVGLIVISLAIGYGYLTPVLSRALIQRISGDLSVRLELVNRLTAAADLAADDAVGWTELAIELARLAHVRVTLLDVNSRVLSDSEVTPEALQQLENHRDRPEIIGALHRGHGESTRYSHTLGLRMYYVAAPFYNSRRQLHGIARLALPLSEVDQLVSQLHLSFAIAALLALSVATLMSSIATHFAARSVRALTAAARRIVGSELGMGTPPDGGDEVAALGRDLDILASTLSKALHQLVEERDLLNSILSGMHEGVLLIELGGDDAPAGTQRVRLCNPALREMLLLAENPTGLPLPPEAAGSAQLRELIALAQKSAQPVIGEVEIAGIKPRRLLVRIAKLGSASAGLLAVLVDVTELRRLESLRRDFVANVSHELRTPVTAMRSAAETIRDAAASDPEAAARFLEIIERNGERLQRMIEDLLDLSRIESQELRLQPADLALPELVTHHLELLRSRADQKRIQLHHELADDLPPVHVDRRALEQVLVNLLDNAIKYCPAGSRITVRAVRSASTEDTASVLISVIDNGPGIAAHHLPRLFERFYRVDAGRSRELGGTGLGLAIVKHLVEAMQGEIWVRSEQGRGAVFSFTLPQAATRT
ncbi:MAG TPA: ATP-binding protein [Pseudomonadota bacterium]|nr:ATP-binding protein [Pseudomonadota bacterium]